MKIKIKITFFGIAKSCRTHVKRVSSKSPDTCNRQHATRTYATCHIANSFSSFFCCHHVFTCFALSTTSRVCLNIKCIASRFARSRTDSTSALALFLSLVLLRFCLNVFEFEKSSAVALLLLFNSHTHSSIRTHSNTDRLLSAVGVVSFHL